MIQINQPSIMISYILQAIGFVLILLAWSKAAYELKKGKRFYNTRLLLFVITSITLSAYIVPTLIAACYFVPDCFQPWYRDVMRLFSGGILFLYGLFKFLLYYTKDTEYGLKI